MLLDWIRSYLMVIGEGSINLAATRLRITQPALSRQMRALEREIGTQLLERGARGVSPTAAGKAFAREAIKVEAACDRAVNSALDAARGPANTLRVGYLQSAARALLTPALTALRRRHREWRVELRDLSPGEQIRALRAGEIDVAIAGQEGAVLGREFYARTLARLGVVAALPFDHPLAGRASLDLRELRGESFIRFPGNHMPGRDRWVRGLARRAGFRPRCGPEPTDIAHLFALVAAEGAVALLPDYFDRVPIPGISLVPVGAPLARWELVAMWRRSGPAAQVVRTLLESLSDQARQLGSRSDRDAPE